MIRHGDWKLIEEGATYYGWPKQPLQLYNIRDDPFEKRNLAADQPDLVAKLRKRLKHHRQFAREGESIARIPGYPVAVYGERENARHEEKVRTKLELLGIYDRDVTIRSRQTGTP